MGRMKLRVGGTWVDSNRSGAVRYNSTTVPYGPPAGPTYEAIDWRATPAITDATDSTNYVMGCSFTVSTSKPCHGIRWRVPDTVTTPGPGSHYATLFSLSPNTKLAQRTFVPITGADQDILFTTPVTLNTGVTYTVSILTIRYVFRAANTAGNFPFTSPSGVVSTSTGRLSSSSDPDTVPGGEFASIFYISPLVGL